MIYTITCNPALDCTVRLGEWQQGTLNLAEGCVLTPGGKGVNVSRVLTAIKEKNIALGFVAGSNGGMLESALKKMGVKTDLIHLDEGQTRINVKLYGDAETELNAPGAPVSAEDLERLEQQLLKLGLGAEDTVCLCGSLAPGMPSDTYKRLVHQLHTLGVERTVVDTSGEALICALAERPWLIKPNREELAALTGRDLPTLDSVVAAAGELQAKGARNVLVSLGGDGAVLCTEEGERVYQPAPEGTVIGTVGAGDSMVAGFVAAYTRIGTFDEGPERWLACLRIGVACGSATAFSEGLATEEAFLRLLKCLPEEQEL